MSFLLVYILYIFLIVYLSVWIWLTVDEIKTRDKLDWFIFIWYLTWPIILIAYWRYK